MNSSDSSSFQASLEDQEFPGEADDVRGPDEDASVYDGSSDDEGGFDDEEVDVEFLTFDIVRRPAFSKDRIPEISVEDQKLVERLMSETLVSKVNPEAVIGTYDYDPDSVTLQVSGGDEETYLSRSRNPLVQKVLELSPLELNPNLDMGPFSEKNPYVTHPSFEEGDSDVEEEELTGADEGDTEEAEAGASDVDQVDQEDQEQPQEEESPVPEINLDLSSSPDDVFGEFQGPEDPSPPKTPDSDFSEDRMPEVPEVKEPTDEELEELRKERVPSSVGNVSEPAPSSEEEDHSGIGLGSLVIEPDDSIGEEAEDTPFYDPPEEGPPEEPEIPEIPDIPDDGFIAEPEIPESVGGIPEVSPEAGESLQVSAVVEQAGGGPGLELIQPMEEPVRPPDRVVEAAPVVVPAAAVVAPEPAQPSVPAPAILVAPTLLTSPGLRTTTPKAAPVSSISGEGGRLDYRNTILSRFAGSSLRDIEEILEDLSYLSDRGDAALKERQFFLMLRSMLESREMVSSLEDKFEGSLTKVQDFMNQLVNFEKVLTSQKESSDALYQKWDTVTGSFVQALGPIQQSFQKRSEVLLTLETKIQGLGKEILKIFSAVKEHSPGRQLLYQKLTLFGVLGCCLFTGLGFLRSGKALAPASAPSQGVSSTIPGKGALEDHGLRMEIKESSSGKSYFYVVDREGNPVPFVENKGTMWGELPETRR